MTLTETAICLSVGKQLRRIDWDQWLCNCDNCVEYRAGRPWPWELPEADKAAATPNRPDSGL